MEIKIFVNNPWQENTYLLFDETKEAILIDCGCFYEKEREAIRSFLNEKGLTLVKVLNTHLHIDHVFGNAFIKKEFNLSVCASKFDEYLLKEAPRYAVELGLGLMEEPPAIGDGVLDGDVIEFGNTSLRAIHTPGHSPGGMCYYCEESKILFAGDSLFAGSIGRTDLPGGSQEKLVYGLKTKVLVLPGDVKVYTGHGAETTISYEKYHNPFLA